MKKLSFKILVTLILVFLIFPISYSKEREIQVEVDYRVELVTIIQYIGGYRYPTRLDFPYKQEVTKYFDPYKGQDSVRKVQNLMKNSIPRDTAIAIPLYLSPVPELKVVIPFSNALIERAGGEANVLTLVDAMRSFAKNSNFLNFINKQKNYYQTIEDQTKQKLQAQKSLEQLESYYGIKQNSYHIILASLIQCGGFGPNVEREDHTLDVYSIIGPCNVDKGIPNFGGEEEFEEIIFHEFSHSFINPITSENISEVNKYSKLYNPISKEMESIRYGLWEICLNEHLVRAFIARITNINKGDDAERIAIETDIKIGFVYLPYFVDLYKIYENSRKEYPNYKVFYPRILQLLKELCQYPLIPTHLSVVTVSNNEVVLEWKDNSNDELEFRIYRSDSFDGSYDLLSTVPKNSDIYSDIDIESGKTYRYKLSAYNQNGEIMTYPVKASVPFTSPISPTNFRFESVIGQRANLAWDYSSRCSGFILYEMPDRKEIQAIPKEQRSMELTSVPFGDHTYLLTAFNELESEKKFCKKEPTVSLTVLKPPTNLQAKAIDSSSIEITWTYEEEASDKIVILRRNEDKEFQIIKEIERRNQFIDENLEPDMEYEYKVFSKKGVLIRSSDSKSAKAKTKPKEPVVEIITLKFQVGKKTYWINDDVKEMDVSPILKEGRLFLPIRYVANALYASVEWDSIEQKTTIQLGFTKIELWIGKNIARINEILKPIDVNNPNIKPFISGGRTFLPLRFVGESLGCEVKWDSQAQEAILIYKRIT